MIDMSIPLATDEDGHINCSAEFGMSPLVAVRVTYNTDPEGNWVADDNYENFTLHGPMTRAEADLWIQAYPDGDRDLKDMDVIEFNEVRQR